MLAALGGNCTLPVAAFAEPADGDGAGPLLRVSGLVASGDGRIVVRLAREGDDPEALGAAVAARCFKTAAPTPSTASTSARCR